MTLTLVRKLLRDVRWPLLVVALLLFGFSLLWVKVAQRVTTEIAPFFNGLAMVSKINPKLFEEVVFKGPGKVSQSVLGGGDIKFERPTDFLSVELMHPVVLMLVSIWAVGRAAGAVAGELDRGTMELLLSQPVPRNRLILAHLIADAVVIPVLCVSIWAGTQAGLAVVGPFAVDYSILDKLPKGPGGLALPRGPDELDVDVARQPHAILNLAALAFAVSGLTLAVSAMNRSRWRAIGIAVVVVMTMFIVNVLGQLWEGAAFLRPASVFFYYQPQRVWLREDWLVNLGEVWDGGPNVPMLAVLAGVGAVGYLVALRVFTRRDLPAPL
jgi:ABC-2 type transport system permease protein